MFTQLTILLLFLVAQNVKGLQALGFFYTSVVKWRKRMMLKYFSFTVRTQFDFDPFPILSNLLNLHRLDITDAKIVIPGDTKMQNLQVGSCLKYQKSDKSYFLNQQSFMLTKLQCKFIYLFVHFTYSDEVADSGAANKILVSPIGVFSFWRDHKVRLNCNVPVDYLNIYHFTGSPRLLDRENSFILLWVYVLS